MSSVASSIWKKGKSIGSNLISTAIEYPLVSSTIGLSSSALAIYYTRRSSFYQRYHTVIKTLALLSSVFGGYVVYRKFKPYIDELLRAKDLLANSNPKRMFIPQDQLKVIGSTSHQAFVVTLDALHSAMVDLFQAELARKLVLQHRKETIGGIFINYYKTAILGQYASSIVLTGIVHHFNAVSVGVTFRFSDSDRRMVTALNLSQQQDMTMQRIITKLNQYYGQLTYYSQHISHLRQASAQQQRINREKQQQQQQQQSANPTSGKPNPTLAANHSGLVIPSPTTDQDDDALRRVLVKTSQELLSILQACASYQDDYREQVHMTLRDFFTANTDSTEKDKDGHDDSGDAESFTALETPLSRAQFPSVAFLHYNTPSELNEDINTILSLKRFNSQSDSTQLQSLLHSAVTDALNLIYQSTLTVLFPVVAQIAADIAFESCYIPTPLSSISSRDDYLQTFHAKTVCGEDTPEVGHEQQVNHAMTESNKPSSSSSAAAAASTDTNHLDTTATTSTPHVDQSQQHNTSQPELTSSFDNPYFIHVDPWVNSFASNDDIMVMLDSVTAAVYNVLITPSPWIVKFTDTVVVPHPTEGAEGGDQSHPANGTNTDTNSVETSMPISDYIISYGYGGFKNPLFRPDPADPTKLRLFNEGSDAQDNDLVTLQPKSHVHDNLLQRQYGFPLIKDMLVPTYFRTSSGNTTSSNPSTRGVGASPSPVASAFSHNTSPSDDQGVEPPTLLSHLLLPVAPLLNAVTQRVQQLPSRELAISPSSLGILTSSSLNLVNSMGSDLFGTAGMGGGDSSILGTIMNSDGGLPQPSSGGAASEEPVRLDVKEIYLRRVLQVIGELLSVMTCKSIHTPPQSTHDLVVSSMSPYNDPFVRALHPYHHQHFTTAKAPAKAPTEDAHGDVESSPQPLPCTSTLVIDVYRKASKYAIFFEIYKDILVLLSHTRRVFSKTTPDEEKLALFRIRKLSQLYPAFLPPYATIQDYQEQQRRSTRQYGNTTPDQHHHLVTMSPPDSYSNALKLSSVDVGGLSRDHVSSYMVRTIASSIGVEKEQSNNILDMFGLDEGNLDSLQRLFALGGDDDDDDGIGDNNSNYDDDSDDDHDGDDESSGWFASITSFLGFTDDNKTRSSKSKKSKGKKSQSKSKKTHSNNAGGIPDDFDMQMMRLLGGGGGDDPSGLLSQLGGSAPPHGGNNMQAGQANDLMRLLMGGGSPGVSKGKKKGGATATKKKTTAKKSVTTASKNTSTAKTTTASKTSSSSKPTPGPAAVVNSKSSQQQSKP